MGISPKFTMVAATEPKFAPALRLAVPPALQTISLFSSEQTTKSACNKFAKNKAYDD